VTVRKLPKKTAQSVSRADDGYVVSEVMGEVIKDERVSKEPKQRMLTYALTKPRVVVGYVTLTQLAAEKGMQPQLARIYMHRAKIKKPAEGWRWPAKSAALKKVRKALGLSF
jgi:hypothetical protein